MYKSMSLFKRKQADFSGWYKYLLITIFCNLLSMSCHAQITGNAMGGANAAAALGGMAGMAGIGGIVE